MNRHLSISNRKSISQN